MKPIVALLLILVIVGLFAWGVCERWERTARSKREAAYQSDLRSFTQVVKPGMTRKEVEAYLYSKNISYMQECCVVTEDSGARHSWDDLAQISSEDHPWFCRAHHVYLAFQFRDYAPQRETLRMQDNDLDMLRSITIYHPMEGCL